MRAAENDAERDLLLQEFAQIRVDHPNAHSAYRRGLLLASTAHAPLHADLPPLLDLGGIAKYASTRPRRGLIR